MRFALLILAIVVSNIAWYTIGRWVKRRDLTAAHKREMRENVLLRMVIGIPIHVPLPPAFVSRAIAEHVAGHRKPRLPS